MEENNIATPRPPTSHISPIPLISLTTLTILSFILSIFLGYQSIQLRKEIERLKTSVAVVPSPTPTTISDPTTKWKTYINNSFNFSVKYNPIFNPSEVVGSVQQLALISFGSMKNNGFDIEVTTGDTIGYYKNRITDQGEKIDKEEKIIVNETAATKLTYKQIIVINKFDVSKVIITKNNRDYIITALASDIDQILSTFKFIDLESQ